MKRFAHDKYGRGSAAANGEGFVDLAPGDTLAYSVANGVAFSVEAAARKVAALCGGGEIET